FSASFALKSVSVTPASAIAMRSAGSCSMIRLRRRVLTMRFAFDLIQPMPPTGATVQRSDDASFKISEISSADAGETVTVPLLDEMYSSPTICDSDLSRKGAKESLRRKGGLNSSLRLGDSFAPLRETSTFASPQPRNIGTIFPGLQSPSG